MRDRSRYSLAAVKIHACTLWLALALTTGWTGAPALGQELPVDLTELMNIDVLSIDVLGTHTHLQGEWMIGSRTMFMDMKGNRDGTDKLTLSQVLRDFPVTPTDMTMHMQMIEIMYAPKNNLTLMAMLPYLSLSMDHVTRMGTRFTTDSEGISDLKIKALHTFYESNSMSSRHRLLLATGLSFPTGSIDEKGDTPAGSDQKLPYPMQLGSGTFDLLPGLTYLGEKGNWAWGGEVSAKIRLGENSNDYTLGHRYHLSAWGLRKWTDWLALSTRIEAKIWEDIEGADPDLNPAMVPTADPERRGGESLDLSLGVDLYLPRGPLKGSRFGIEVGFPLYQSLDGPQLETDWNLAVGWSFTRAF